MELKDEQTVNRKEFIKKMKEERQRLIYQKRDPSPADVLIT